MPYKSNHSEICFFSGHRKVRLHQISPLQAALTETVADLVEQGYRCFVCGGAQGFDTLAAQTVIQYRNFMDIPICLYLVIPFEGQCNRWLEKDRIVYREIAHKANRVFVLERSNTPGCMLRRNRIMARWSSKGIFFYDGRQYGATAYTYRYFQDLGPGRELINLYQQVWDEA